VLLGPLLRGPAFWLYGSGFEQPMLEAFDGASRLFH
jgi:hypothetical protein